MTSRNSPCACGSGAKYKKCCLPKDEGQRKPHTGEDAVIVCMPTRGQVSHETLLSLEQNMTGVRHGLLRIARKPVAEARNLLAKSALEMVARNPFPFTPREIFILWLDDDAWLPPSLVPTMLQCMREPAMQAVDALFGWFCTRKPYAPPVAYRKINDSNSFPRIGIDCKNGDLVDIEAAGFHAVLMRTRLLQRIGPEPFTPNGDEGEDIAFCRRAKAIGARLVVGTAFPLIHVDPRDGMAYMVGEPAAMMDGNGLRTITSEHKATRGIKAGEARTYGLDDAEARVRAEDERVTREMQAELAQRRQVAQAAHV